MAQQQPRPGPWQSLRRLPGRTPLRVKLIAVVLALVTAALAVISVAGILFLRGYLLNQVDQELESGLLRSGPYVANYLATGQTQPAQYSIQWLNSRGQVRLVAGEPSARYGNKPRYVPGPQVRTHDSWLSRGTRASEPVTVSAVSGGGRWRVMSKQLNILSPDGTITGTMIVGVDVTTVYRTCGELVVIDLIISCALLAVLAVFGVAVVRASMRPLDDIEQTAVAIAAGDLARRVPERDPRTEVGRLGRSLNTMLTQIEAAFRARTASEEAARRSEESARQSAMTASRSEARMRQFVADASHELRTPLTAIRGFAEYYRQRGGVASANGAAGSADGEGRAVAVTAPGGHLDHADVDRIIERVEGEATRMGVLVDDMLLLARLDQQRPLDAKTVDLLAIAADALHDARLIAPQRSINLTVSSPEAALVIGDEVGLRQVVGNLMSNAMTHTPAGTPIDITIRAGTLANGHQPSADQQPAANLPAADLPAEPAVILEVADRGPGLTAEQQEHVFERFYRTDRARTRKAGGTGLGLAIVAAMVSAHHGKVWVESQPGEGATFGFALPLAPEARPSQA